MSILKSFVLPSRIFQSLHRRMLMFYTKGKYYTVDKSDYLFIGSPLGTVGDEMKVEGIIILHEERPLVHEVIPRCSGRNKSSRIPSSSHHLANH